ncbi:MAG: hypothetical protein GXP49_10295 [Deltaproteobacteria bacterium]|nr:hypothetical protein [Deltaproteobacteria bacterium]
MLTKKEATALYQWYSRKEIIDKIGYLVKHEDLEELEEYIHMTCLFPLSRHSELPEFMKAGNGEPLFPNNLNPKKDLENWQDAIEIGWQVVEEHFGLTHDEAHRKIARLQKQDWDAFLDSVEKRKQERRNKDPADK